MTDKIRTYIEESFLDVPKTKKIEELKDELYANLVDKYKDQLENGKTEGESYNIAIASIGDLEELVQSVKIPSPLQPVSQVERKRSAIFVSVAVMLYILSPIAVIFFEEIYKNDFWGILFMFLFIAIATALLIYNNMTKPVYQRTDETLVEEFKEWKGQFSQKKAAIRSFKSGFWSLVVIFYLSLSFIFGIWAFSWLIFIAAAAVIHIAEGIYYLKGESDE